jgi:hypothetical protein
MSRPRTPTETVRFIDEYCAFYQHIFPDVHSFEQFKWPALVIVPPSLRSTCCVMSIWVAGRAGRAVVGSWGCASSALVGGVRSLISISVFAG